MYEGYTEAVREELPQAKIVIDRFHVTRHYSKAADKLRQRELKRLTKELSVENTSSSKGICGHFAKSQRISARKSTKCCKNYSEKLPS